MMGLFRSAFVIGRRDFTATVFSKTFLFFLLGPLLIIGISVLFGNAGERMARQDIRARIAVVATAADFAPIAAARARLQPAFREGRLLELERFEPDYVLDAQVKELLSSSDKRILAVLTGGAISPKLIGAFSKTGSVQGQIAAIVEEARQQRALQGAGVRMQPVKIELVKVAESAGSLATMRALTARMGQMLLFLLTVLLATMLLSNLVEEKTNKVIEVLAAAVSVDAIFLGKLFSMLAVSLVGIAVWAIGAVAALILMPSAGALPEPAVGWPLFVLLLLLYYAMIYLLFGAVFLGIGSQASSIREVQTMTMPVTVAQILILMFAGLAVGSLHSFIGIAAAIFPFSSPLTMVAHAAQERSLWPHLLALVWQGTWAALMIRLFASMFRRRVLKSGGGDPEPKGARSR
jgi:ABC-2 type transport system permease protein